MGIFRMLWPSAKYVSISAEFLLLTVKYFDFSGSFGSDTVYWYLILFLLSNSKSTGSIFSGSSPSVTGGLSIDMVAGSTILVDRDGQGDPSLAARGSTGFECYLYYLLQCWLINHLEHSLYFQPTFAFRQFCPFGSRQNPFLVCFYRLWITNTRNPWWQSAGFVFQQADSGPYKYNYDKGIVCQVLKPRLVSHFRCIFESSV